MANLAITLAESGVRVAIVDADMRRPRLAEMMGLEGAVGLSDVLIGRAALDDVLQEWGSDGLFVLPAGQIPPNPSELLGSQPATDLIDALAEAFDVVLIDAPPLLPVSDAAILSRRTGGAIIVAAAGRTKRSQLHGAIEALGAWAPRFSVSWRRQCFPRKARTLTATEGEMVDMAMSSLN